MIVEYHRPETLQSAVELLSRKNPHTVPLGGGTHLSHYRGDPIAVVDLRRLDLGKIERVDGGLRIGSTVTLQTLMDSDETPAMFKEVLRFEANYNLRQSATIAGTVVTGDGQSAFLSALLALDARVVLQPGGQKEGVSDWLAHRATRNEGVLITGFEVPYDVVVKYDFVGRSPQDLPIVSVCVAEWADGRMRVILGGEAVYPILAMDSKDMGVVELSIKIACSQLLTSQNSDYILETGKTLARRLLANN